MVAVIPDEVGDIWFQLAEVVHLFLVGMGGQVSAEFQETMAVYIKKM